MSEDQIDIELVERNYKAFARYAHPAAAQRLRDHKPLSKLVRNEDGDWDVEFRGELLYGKGGRARAEKMAEDVRNNPHCRFKLYPMATRSLDRAAGEYLFHLMKHATDDGITFQDIPTTPEGYHLISFGLGLGYHLPNLVEMTKCECLTIVETNMDFLYHSMAVMDWTPMLERNKGWPFVAMLTDPNGISEAVRAHCRLNNPTSVDWGLVISAYHNDTMVQAIRELQRDAAMIMMGLGFLVDEAEMARASYLNLCQGADYRLFKKREARANAPAFIVGSGPSIDQDIEIIKELQDQAVIFACGTSSRILLANGIKPDFMLLLENGEVPYGAMEKVAQHYDVGDAVMIASNTVSQRIKSICKETVFFFRPALCPYPVFCPGPEFTFSNPGPTVVNTGVGAALGLGFRELYLFGVDLGSRHKDRHHSAHSAYVKKEGDKDDEVLPFDAVFDNPAVGNFGGVVFTESIMEWTRDTLAKAAADYARSAVIYNCSDGARIDHTIAKASEAIELLSTPDAKRQAIAAIMAHLPKVAPDEAMKKWQAADGLKQIKDLTARLKEKVATFPDSSPAFVRGMLPILLTDHSRIPSFGEFFIRGSVFMALAASDYYVRRTSTPEMRQQMEALVCEEFVRFMNNIENWADWYFDHFTEYTSSLDLERDFSELPYE